MTVVSLAAEEPSVPTVSTMDLPAPLSWEELEEICWDLFRREWDDTNAVRHGRQGQPQDGVDIYGGRNDHGHYAGIQCKARGKGSLLSPKG
jgi:hypothetical protein